MAERSESNPRNAMERIYVFDEHVAAILAGECQTTVCRPGALRKGEIFELCVSGSDPFAIAWVHEIEMARPPGAQMVCFRVVLPQMTAAAGSPRSRAVPPPEPAPAPAPGSFRVLVPCLN
jgi:hypothetical protein